jgi:hypothetical protein
MATDIDDNIADAGDLVSVEAFSAIADAINALMDSTPVGSICTIAVGLPGVPAPDSRVWQECDGAPITETLSPLFGQNAPDLRDRYLRGASSVGQIGLYGGSNTKNLQHSHGGATQNADAAGGAVDASSGYWEAVAHNHPISNDLNTPINFEPVHITCKHYLKIR